MTPHSDEFAARVREAVDLVALVSEHTGLEQRGRRLLGLCPFHDEKTPSFSIDAERGLYYCFGCGAGGDAFRFHMQVTGDDFPRALEALARRFGVPVPKRHEQEDSAAEEVLEAAQKWFVAALSKSSFARDYLARRRISQELIERYAVGYAPDAWRDLLESLTPRFSLEQLIVVGLVGRARSDDRPYDRFRHRLMFPIRSSSGRLVGFGGRTLGDDRAKYVNTAETPSFRKGELLYGLDLARAEARASRRLLLVEGYFDVLAAVESGIPWTVASMGTALTQTQAKRLADYAEEVIVGYDGDRAGEEAAGKALPLLLRQGLAVRRARFPSGQDPDSLRLEAGPGALADRIHQAPDAVVNELQRLPAGDLDARSQSRHAKVFADLLGNVADRVMRYSYAKQAAERLGIPPDLLLPERGTPGRVTARKVPAAGGVTTIEPEAQPSPGAKHEERAIRLLLEGAQAPWPKADVFWDSGWREVFEAACRVREEGLEPGDDEFVSRLQAMVSGETGGVDRLARVLLEDAADATEGEFKEAVERLNRRNLQRQQRDLMRELRDAAKRGDQERLTILLSEKEKLSREYHLG